MNHTRDITEAINLGLDNAALVLEEARVGAAVLKALAATDRLIQELLIELLAPAHMRRKAEDAFAILAGGVGQMVDLDARDERVARELCAAQEALTKRAAGKAALV